jgi:acetylornithine deacetylase/succinyl-diaminopimelate desuccinylase-like protein
MNPVTPSDTRVDAGSDAAQLTFRNAEESALTEDELAGLLQLLSFPTVSAVPARRPDIYHAATWLADRCNALGLENARVVESSGLPCVYADWLHAPGRPTLLLYAHFDVQPVVDQQAWQTAPFTPMVKADRVYARGAADMKCGLWASLLAVGDMLHANAGLPVNLRILFEGEEEVLSPHLRSTLHDLRDELACDFAVTADGAQPRTGRPTIGVGSRGFCNLEVLVEVADADVHSGIYGGATRNAAHVLANLVASLHDRDGRVAVPAFYDDVHPLSERDRAALGGALQPPLPRSFGSLGESEWTPYERTTLRPAVDVNGISAGYTGAGPMTVIPARAQAKLSCRLVPNQDPITIRELVADHLRRHAPEGVEVTVTTGSASPAYRCPVDAPIATAAAAVLREMTGREPHAILSGGSLPVQAFLHAELGVHTVTFGFSREDEGIHSANEFHRLRSIQDCRFAYRELLDRLGGAA